MIYGVSPNTYKVDSYYFTEYARVWFFSFTEQTWRCFMSFPGICPGLIFIVFLDMPGTDFYSFPEQTSRCFMSFPGICPGLILQFTLMPPKLI
jgi:hypothetical protein